MFFSCFVIAKSVRFPGKYCTLIKKENQIFLIYEGIQSGAVAKSYIRRGFLIYEKMRKYFPIHEEAVSHIWLCNCSIINFLIYEENLIFIFITVPLAILRVFLVLYRHFFHCVQKIWFSITFFNFTQFFHSSHILLWINASTCQTILQRKF